MRLAPALAALLLTTSGVEAQRFHAGAPVSDFQVVDSLGVSHSFASLKGDTTVVAFISARCPISNAYNRRMEAIYQDYSPKGVRFLFVNANFNEPAKEVTEHAKAVGFTFPVYQDSGNVAELFDAQVTPETYLIDRQGIIRYHGAIDDSANEARVRRNSLRDALDEALAGKSVTVAETKAFGCSVKRVRHPSTD